MRKKIRILFAGLVVLALLTLWNLLRPPGGEAAVVTARVDGTVIGRWSLAEDTEADTDTVYGHNRIRIRGGSAQMCEADCPDGYCLRQHAIGRQRGGMIICLPHHLVISTEGGSPSPDDPEPPDTVAQ